MVQVSLPFDGNHYIIINGRNKNLKEFHSHAKQRSVLLWKGAPGSS